MRSTTTLVAAAIAIVGGLGWTYAATDDGPIANANQLRQNWIDAYNKRDAATLASLYVINAIVTPEGQPDLQTFFDEGMKQSALDNLQIRRSDLTLIGEVVVGRGSWSADVPAQKGAEVKHVTGTYLAIATKLVGAPWKFLSVDWNWDALPTAR